MLLELLNRFKLPVFNFSASEVEKICRPALILFAITAVMYALVGIFYDIVSIKLMGKSIAKPVQERPMPAISFQKQPADYYAVIPQRNLFGSTDKAVAEKKQEAAKLEVALDLSTLLVVKGTVAGTGKDGFAVIEEKAKNKQSLYKVGNFVAGAKLIKITRNAVTFQIDNQEKVLRMMETQEVPLLPSRPGQQTASFPSMSGPMVISRNDVAASLKDMGTMMGQAQIRPYYTAGAPDGFLITNIRPGSLYEKVGLREGDIIQGTGDRKLLTADDWTFLYNSMKTGSSLTLKIKRGGAEEALNYVFR
ncbi:MAG TPA: type II secretion system protein N [Syntrophales bacterium]|nr:type II secretion system protein N [Syntrophales bacterium]